MRESEDGVGITREQKRCLSGSQSVFGVIKKPRQVDKLLPKCPLTTFIYTHNGRRKFISELLNAFFHAKIDAGV